MQKHPPPPQSLDSGIPIVNKVVVQNSPIGNKAKPLHSKHLRCGLLLFELLLGGPKANKVLLSNYSLQLAFICVFLSTCYESQNQSTLSYHKSNALRDCKTFSPQQLKKCKSLVAHSFPFLPSQSLQSLHPEGRVALEHGEPLEILKGSAIGKSSLVSWFIFDWMIYITWNMKRFCCCGQIFAYFIQKLLASHSWARSKAQQTLAAQISRSKSHPSLCFWALSLDFN